MYERKGSRLTIKMTNNLHGTAVLIPVLSLLAGCNMPTPPAEIRSAYVSDLRYESFNCAQLATERDALSKREGELVAVQKQRIDSSKTQAFWWGYGQGDGLEASELANVRGEEAAIGKAMAKKGCAAGDK
jgi:hypothetical protein